MEDKFQGFLRQREEEKRKVKEEMQDEEEVCSLHPLPSPKLNMEEQHVIEISPDRLPDKWDDQERNKPRKILGLSNDMCIFLDELLQEQGKAGEEEGRERKDDANEDKLCQPSLDKLPEAKQGNWCLQAWCRGEWAQS
jgi:hypothetical protein